MTSIGINNPTLFPDVLSKEVSDFLDLKDGSMRSFMLTNRRIHLLINNSTLFVIVRLIKELALKTDNIWQVMDINQAINRMGKIKASHIQHLIYCLKRIDPKDVGTERLIIRCSQINKCSITTLLLKNELFTLALIKNKQYNAIKAMEIFPFFSEKEKHNEYNHLDILVNELSLKEIEENCIREFPELAENSEDLEYAIEVAEDEEFEMREEIANDYRLNQDFWLKCYRISPKCAKLFSKDLFENEEFMLKIARISLEGLECMINTKLFKNPQFMGKISLFNPHISHLISIDDKSNTKFMCALMSLNGYMLKLANSDMQKNGLVAFEAVKQEGLSIQYAPTACRQAKAFARAAITQNPRAYKFIEEPAKNDPEIKMLAQKT